MREFHRNIQFRRNEIENQPSEPQYSLKRTLLAVSRRELVADDRVALHAPLDQSVLQSHRMDNNK